MHRGKEAAIFTHGQLSMLSFSYWRRGRDPEGPRRNLRRHEEIMWSPNTRSPEWQDQNQNSVAATWKCSSRISSACSSMTISTVGIKWLVKRLWLNRNVSHPTSLASPCSFWSPPRMHKMTLVPFSPANLLTLITGEISGDKQLLLHIKSVVHRCWLFSYGGISIINQL